MNTLDVNEVAFNLVLFKRLGFHQMFSPHSPKVWNYNVYRLVPIILIVTTICCNTFYGWIGFFANPEETIEDTNRLQMMFVYLNYYLSSFKLCICIYNADKIWDLLEITSINFVTSKECFKYINILYEYRHLSIKITNFICAFITTTVLAWWVFPILVNFVFNSKSDDKMTAQRLENINNFRYPVSIETYNHYYFLIYVSEAASGLVIEYGILIVDVLLISISYVFIAHYEIHQTAFTNLGHLQNFPNENENGYYSYYEDFKSIMIDQQNLNLKLKLYYSIVWPIIIFTVAVSSGSVILLAYEFVMIFMAAEYIPILHIIKLGSAFFFLCIELFIHCYLFEIIQIKKDMVAFGVYCCNWTAMNMKFKKLVLLTMRMNDGNKLMMNFTQQKKVNLQFFANVMMTCYNMISVILRTRMKNNEIAN